MPANSETILTTQTHPGDSTVETVTGEKYKGDGYYGRSDGFHSVQYTVEGFIGSVAVQATLAVEPEEADWFTVVDHEFLQTTDISRIANFTGNYVWIRSKVYNWTDGTVNSIILNH